MRNILIILLLFSSLFSKVVSVTTTGEYEQLEFTKTSPIPDETSYARSQAMAFAKARAIEEAGTTIYSSFSSVTKLNGKNKAKRELKAIASALIKTKVLKEGWHGKFYRVKIKAEIDVKDAEEVFAKADKRLRDITKLQQQNEKILADIKKISKKIFSMGRNSHTTTSKLELHQMSTKQKKQYYKQVELLDKYEENILMMEAKFEKGTLLKMAYAEEKRSNAAFENAKRIFDEEFVDMYREDFIAKFINIKVVKHGNSADVKFLLLVGNENYGDLTVPLRRWFSGQKKDWMPQPHEGAEYGYMAFKKDDDSIRLRNWIKKNRGLCIKVSLGKMNYYTENFAEYTSYSSKGDNVYKFFKNKDGYLTERVIKNIPLRDLAQMDSISAELVYNKLNLKSKSKGNNHPLPAGREATEYYEY